MSHNIMQRNGKYAMAAARGVAVWHNLETRTTEATATWQEMATAADLLWSIIVQDVYARNPLGKVVKLDDVRGVFRSDDGAYLGNVGSVWEPIQNVECFEWCDALLNMIGGGSHYISAGALGNGETVWTLAKVPFDFSVAEEADKHETYLLFTTRHDGKGAAKAKLVVTQVVCNNTLQAALGEAGEEISIRHTKSAKERMDRAVKLMAGTQATISELKAKLTALADRKLTREKTVDILDRLFPKMTDVNGKEVETTRRDNVVSGVLQCFESNNQNAFPSVQGTAYNLLNAVTEYTDHLRSARGSSNDGKATVSKDTKRAESAMFTSGAKLKSEALEVILEETAPSLIELAASMPVSAARR